MTKNADFSGNATELSPIRDARRHRARWVIVPAIVAGLGLFGCNSGPSDEPPPPPVIMVHQNSAGATAPTNELPPCDGPAGETWIREFRDRVVSHGEFARFAARRFGEPTACHGSVTSEFDGLEFGTLRMEYAQGVELIVETMPVETSITTLHVPGGFDSDDEALTLLRAYSARVGLELDWSRPQTMTVDGRTTTFFEHPEPGFNASGRMISSDGAVRSVNFSLAL